MTSKNKPCIITFCTQYNYGSALQTFALQEAVKGLTGKCAIVNYYYEKDMKQYNIRWYKKNILVLFDILIATANIKRKFAYRNFRNKYLNLTESVRTIEGVKKTTGKYSILIAGSDQIWNLNIHEGIHPVYFLKISEEGQRLISYAASTGKDYIQDEYLQDFCDALRRFHYISVRENGMAQFLSDKLNRNIKCTLDPTLLHEADFYNRLLTGYQLKLPKRYIFVYFLWGKDREQMMSIIDGYVKEYKLKVVYFNKYNIYKKNYALNIFKYDPRAFVLAIKNAEYVFSDSFHACAFSIIYQKQFFVYTGEDSRSRMSSLFELLGINNRFITSSGEEFDDIDYEQVNLRLRNERKKSMEFLEKSICDIVKE